MASPESPTPAPGEAPRDSSPRESSVERRRAVATRRVEMLGELAEAGLSIAKALERRVLELSPALEAERSEPAQAAPTSPEPGPAQPAPATSDTLADLALAYDRVSRSVRQSLMLQERLAHGPRGATRDEGRRRLNELSDAGDAKLTEVAQTLLQVISAEPEDKERVERLLREAWERLEDEEILEDLARRPAHDIAARICRDIGVTSDWCHFAFELRSGRTFETAGLTPDGLGPKPAPEPAPEPSPGPWPYAEPYVEFLLGAGAPDYPVTPLFPATPSAAAPNTPQPATRPSTAQGP